MSFLVEAQALVTSPDAGAQAMTGSAAVTPRQALHLSTKGITMRTHKLVHITDLANLSEEDLAQFIKELPSIAATLRLLRANADGVPLAEVLPHLTFAPDIGDNVVMRAEGRVLTVPGAIMVSAERLNGDASGVADSAISQARRRVRP